MYLRLAVLHIEMLINPYCRKFRACNAIVSCAVQSYDWQRSILYIILYSPEQIVIYSHIVIVFHCRYWRDKWVNIPIQNISCSWKMHDVQRYRRKQKQNENWKASLTYDEFIYHDTALEIRLFVNDSKWPTKFTKVQSPLCASVNKSTIGSDTGLLPVWCHNIIWTNADIVLIRPLRWDSILYSTKSITKYRLQTIGFQCVEFQHNSSMTRKQEIRMLCFDCFVSRHAFFIQTSNIQHWIVAFISN